MGSGAYGGVWMAVDIARKRQMACKMVKLGKSPQQQSGRVRFSEPLWREVDLLKDISHVRKAAPLWILAHQMFSQTSYMSSVYSLPKTICMTVLSISVFELTPLAISFQTLLREETLCLTLNGHGPRWMMRRHVCIPFEHIHPRSGPHFGLQDMSREQEAFDTPLSCLIA